MSTPTKKGKGSCDIGNLQLMISYTSNTELLKVGVLQLRDLQVDTPPGTLMHHTAHTPHSKVRVNLKSEGKFFKRQTPFLAFDSKCTWNETIGTYKLPAALLAGQELRSQVVRDDDVILAETMVPLSHIQGLADETHIDWYSLRPIVKIKKKFFSLLRRQSEDNGKFLSWLEAQNRLLELETSVQEADLIKRLQGYQNNHLEQVAKTNPRLHACWDLLSTELQNFSHLFLVCMFRKMLIRTKKKKTQLFKRFYSAEGFNGIDVDAIFGNVQQLKKVSLKTLLLLEALLLNKDGVFREEVISSTQLGVVLKIIQDRYLPAHLQYQLHAPRALQYVQDQTDPVFLSFTMWCEEDIRCDGQSFVDLLAKPLRLAKEYPNLFKNVAQQLPSSPQQSALLKQILEVESGIKCHHDVADDFHERDKLTQLCNDLIWDSCLESSSDCYIPEEYSQDLGKRPQVALEAEQHSLSRDKFPHRRLAYHSEARILGTGGSIGKLVFCYLIGDLLLLCQYLSPHKRKEESDCQKLEVYYRPIHVSELDVLLLPKEDKHAKDSLIILVKSNLGFTEKCLSLKYPHEHIKTNWLRFFRNAVRKAQRPKHRAILSLERTIPEYPDLDHGAAPEDQSVAALTSSLQVMRKRIKRSRAVSENAAPRNLRKMIEEPTTPPLLQAPEKRGGRRRSLSSPPRFADEDVFDSEEGEDSLPPEHRVRAEERASKESLGGDVKRPRKRSMTFSKLLRRNKQGQTKTDDTEQPRRRGRSNTLSKMLRFPRSKSEHQRKSRPAKTAITVEDCDVDVFQGCPVSDKIKRHGARSKSCEADPGRNRRGRQARASLENQPNQFEMRKRRANTLTHRPNPRRRSSSCEPRNRTTRVTSLTQITNIIDTAPQANDKPRSVELEGLNDASSEV